MTLTKADFQLFSFLLAIIIYALFSSPTPDDFGLGEILIAIFLLMAVGFREIKNLGLK